MREGGQVVYERLRQRHRELEELFSGFDGAADDDERKERFAELAPAVLATFELEERHFYPALEDPAFGPALRSARADHLEARRVLAIIAGTDPDDRGFAGRAGDFIQLVRAHLAEEDSQLVARARKVVPEERLAALDAALSGVDEAPGHLAPALP